MAKKGKKLCSECLKERERCKAVSTDIDGEIEWVCPNCFITYDYDKYLYEYANKQRMRQDEVR